MIQEILGKKGHYIVDRELGAGATGKTYLVIRESDQKQFVLKWLDLAGVDRWKVIERFHREGAVLEQLDHSGIPKYIELIESDNGLALIQTYINGSSWQDLIDQSQPINIKTAFKQLKELLQILSYLNELKPAVIHRDISPKNIMVDQQGKVWLIDFGSVQAALHQHSKTVTTMGTFGYMAPEQIMGQATVQSDIFSLGISLIARISNTNPDDFILSELSGGVDLEKIGIGLSDHMIIVLQQMTAPGLDHRFECAQDALDYFKNPPLFVMQKKWYQKWRYRFLILLLLIFGLLIGGYISTQIPAKGEIRAYGGWFSGHGRLIPGITQTVLYDGTLIDEINRIKSVAFSLDGTKIVTLADQGVIVWEKSSGKIIYKNNTVQGSHVFFDPDGMRIWVSSMSHQGIILMDIVQKKVVPLKMPGVLMKEQGRSEYGLSCRSKLVIQWNKVWRVCRYGTREVPEYPVLFRPDTGVLKLLPKGVRLYDTYLKNGSVANITEKKMTIWSVDGEKSEYPLGLNNGGKDFFVVGSDNGLYFLVKSERHIILLNHKGKQICLFKDRGYSHDQLMAIDEKKGQVAIKQHGGRIIDLYKIDGCQKVTQLQGHDEKFRAISFSPDGTELLSGGEDQRAKLWKMK